MRALLSVWPSLLLLGCSVVGPDYQVPKLVLPANYKEEASTRSGVTARWWTGFQDSRLNSFNRALLQSNLDLRSAYARREQAVAALGVARSDRFPQANLSGSGTRNRASENNLAGGFGANYFDLYEVTGSLGYELDLWGRVKRQVESAVAEAQAADAAIGDVKVALQGQLARNYFGLRFLDAEAEVLREALKSRRDTLSLAETREEGGLTSGLDASRARGELANAEAALLSLAAPRAQFENAIAVLVGKNASTFTIPRKSEPETLPRVGAGLPSMLLLRRPDVAAAERRLAAATARIGVAEANFLPTFRLTGAGGLSSINTNDFLTKSSSVLSIGPSVDAPVFQGGRLDAQLKIAQAGRREALNIYQQATLQAFADVESALAAVNALAQEREARLRAVTATRDAFELSQIRYTEGVDSYLSVIDSQRELLIAERAAVQTRGQQFSAAITLIQALGGSYWK